MAWTTVQPVIKFVKLLWVLLFYICMPTFYVVNTNLLALLALLNFYVVNKRVFTLLQFADTTIVNIDADLVVH